MTVQYTPPFRLIVADPALRSGIIYGITASCAEFTGYVLLVLSVYWMTFEHDALFLSLTLFIGLAVAFGLQATLRGQGLVRDFTGTYRVMTRIRLNVLDHIFAMPEERQSADQRAALIELLTSRFSAVQEIFTHLWGSAIPGITLPLLLLPLIAWLSLTAALILCLSLPITIGMMAFAFHVLDRADAQLCSTREEYAEAILNVVDGAHETRFFDPLNHISSRAETANQNLKAAQMALEIAPAPAILGYALTAHIGMALAIMAIVIGIQHHELASWQALSGIVLAYRFQRCIVELAGQIAGLRFARNTMRRIGALMVRPILEQPSTAPYPQDHSLTLAELSHNFDGNNPTFGGLSTINGTIKPGQKIAIIGASGSGKTTLAHLMLRLQDVDDGAILIGDTNLKHLQRSPLSQYITLVPQDIALFEGTLAENIRLGRPDAPEADLTAAIEQAQLHSVITRLPHGLDTNLQTSATRLSGGEKQRIALARALLMHTPILILDEATAQLDTQNEALIRDALNSLQNDRTLVVIAHRLWVARDADEIWVMDNGRLIERGPHEALLEAGGTYARLWRAQQSVKPWTVSDTPTTDNNHKE